MTSLSSAAQTVAKAANESYWDWAQLTASDPDTIAAATLRAAALFCKGDESILLSLAEELESQ